MPSSDSTSSSPSDDAPGADASDARRDAARSHRERRTRQRARRREAVRMADYSTIGLAFPIAIALCWFAGGWIGGWFGAAEAGNWVGGAFGLIAGFYNVYRTAVLLQEQDLVGTSGEAGPDLSEGPAGDLREGDEGGPPGP